MINIPTPSLKHFLVNLTKPYKKLFSLIVLVGLLWAVINTFLPYTLKLIIDHVVGYEGDKSNLFTTTQPYVFGYILLWTGLCINMRLFEVESGEITIDEQNIKQVTQQSLREQIALIPQDVILFHRSLMENIRFGAAEATDEEVIEIATKAHCHEFISQLSQGYESLVGERGIKLSGGQRQRIAIARAMLKNAPILILDEATSSLDSITEKYIQDALNLIMQNKTTIVIAHRLSTLSKMDRILVFDNGQIIEDGTHEQLVAKGGHYAKMWQMQAGGFLPMKEDTNE